MEYKLEHGRSTNTPTKIIVHAMAEFLEGGDRDLHAAPFLDKLGLSAHILITPSGDLIRCRNDNEGAWHAKGHNTNSLGIEFLVPGCHTYETFKTAIKEDWVSETQYQAGLACIQNWCNAWHIKSVERHSDVSVGRKVDPGKGFPIDRLLSEVII